MVPMQVVAILPELDSRFVQLLKNRHTWNERYLNEIEEDPKRSPDDKVADQVCQQRSHSTMVLQQSLHRPENTN